MDIEFSDDTQPPQEAAPLEAQQPQELAEEYAPEAETPSQVVGAAPTPADEIPSQSIQELDELQKQLEALRQQLAQSVERETRAVKAWQTERAKSRRVEFAQYAGELVSAGKMPPTAQTAVCEFMAGLDGAADVEFADGDCINEKPLLTQFKELLNAVLTPRAVEFSATLTADAALDGTPDTPDAMAARIREQRVALRAAGKHANISQVMHDLGG